MELPLDIPVKEHIRNNWGDCLKRYRCLLACIPISLLLWTGCSNYGNGGSATGAENALTEATSSQSAVTTDWKPTSYKTVDNFDGVTMTVKKGTASPTALTVVFENNSSKKCIYGEYFCLEKKINGGWYQVPVAIEGNYGFNSIGYNLDAEDDREWAIDWDWLYGSLDIGEYRIVKDISDFRGSGDYDKYYLTAEFTI